MSDSKTGHYYPFRDKKKYIFSSKVCGIQMLNVFDFDERKSRLNHDKHGIDFFEAQELWLDDRCLEVRARSEGSLGT